MRRFGKRDSSHAGIKKALLDAGRPVRDVADMAGLGCDILTEHIDGYPLFLECKPGGPPSMRKLTDSEKELMSMFPRFFAIAQTPEEALAAVGL